MKEVCEDFGRRLIRGWDEEASKEEIREYVKESVEAFFKKGKEAEAEEVEVPKKKGTKSKGLETKTKAKEPEEEEVSDNEAEITVESPKKKSRATKKTEEVAARKKVTKKSKGGEKEKCKAVTAKGAPCSKNAVEGCEFCSVHRDKGVPLEKAKGKGGAKAPAKKTKAKVVKKKESKPESAKHAGTHGVDEIDEEGCELCASHGGPFELPEYEAEKAPSVAEEDEEDNSNELDNSKELEDDPDYEVTGGSRSDGGLSEEDFDEDD